MSKKILSVLLALVLLTLLYACGTKPGSGEQTARIITVFKNEGSDIRVTKENNQEFEAKEGFKLSEGYKFTTGVDSYSYLKLDEESLVKVDQQTQLEVSKLNDKNLKLTVVSGAISVDAAPQKPDNTLEVQAGNSALAVRGTLFVVEKDEQNQAKMSMLSGLGDVNGTALKAGFVLDSTQTATDPQPIVINEDLSLFLLEVILENKDLLLQEGTFSQADMDNIANLIAAKKSGEKKQDKEDKDKKDKNGDKSAKDAKDDSQKPATTKDNSSSQKNTTPAADSSPNNGSGNTPAASSQSSASSSSTASSSSSASSRASSSSSSQASSSSSSAASSSSSGSGAAAIIGGRSYNNVYEAINDAQTGEVVEILDNCSIPSGIVSSLDAGAQLFIKNGKTFTVDGTFTIENTANLTVQSGSNFVVNSGNSLKNQGVINIYGQLKNNTTGRIINESTGQINIESTGTFENQTTIADGFSNAGQLHIASGGRFDNLGKFQSAGTLTGVDERSKLYFGPASSNSGTGLQAFRDNQNQPIDPGTLPGKTLLYGNSTFRAPSVVLTAGSTSQYFGSLQTALAQPGGGTITVYENIPLTASIPQGFTLVIPDGITVTQSQRISIDGTLQVEGRMLFSSNATLSASGEIAIAATGQAQVSANSYFSVAGTLRNLGIFTNNSSVSGLLVSGILQNDGSFNNNGRLTVGSAGALTSSGTWLNNSAAALQISGSFTNTGALTNLGTLSAENNARFTSQAGTMDHLAGRMIFKNTSLDISGGIQNSAANTASEIQFKSVGSPAFASAQFFTAAGTQITLPADLQNKTFTWDPGRSAWKI